MKLIKKIIKFVFALILGLCLGLFGVLVFQMYKPVFDASKVIHEVDRFAMDVTDELINRDVKIIGLGEATHGNKEFQELKLDVLKTLVRDNGVSAVCFEMDYGEGVLINDYILGQSNRTSQELFSHISFGIYHTEEMKALIEWLKAYNEESKDGYLEFYGYDFQNPEVDIYVVDEFLKQYDIPYHSEAIEAFLSQEFGFKDERMDEVFQELSVCKEELSDEKYQTCIGIDRIQKCIDNVFLAKELAAISVSDSVGYGTYRDKMMAKNVMEISKSVGYPIMITGHIYNMLL